jgi:SMODS domain-containing protein
MSLVLDAFRVFLQNISLPDSQLAAAQRSHNALRTYLANDDYFAHLTLDTFLNGSYARHTTVQPIKDVDIVVVVKKEWLEGDPTRAMEALRRKLSHRYDDWRTRRHRRAVRVTLSDICLDVLLATAPDGLARPLRIPDRELRSWIKTHPRRQLELVNALSSRTNGNYSRLVRLLKVWARSRVAEPDRPRSFVLECAVYHVVAAKPASFAGAVDEAFALLLQQLVAWDFGRATRFLSIGEPVVGDPALPDVNVAERWSERGADRVREKLQFALKRIAVLGRSRWDDTEVRHWGDVFGSPFPAPSTVVRRLRQSAIDS